MPSRGRPRTFDRREALQSAVEVFLARGYDGATLEDLTAAMGGIAPPSFYAAFESKENLFREAVQLYAETAGGAGRLALEGPKVREAIEGMLRASTDAFSNPNGPGGCLVLLGAINCSRANHDTHEFMRAIRRQPPALIRKRIERAIAEGELSDSVDAEAVASFYTTVLNGLSLRARDGASRATLHASIDGAMAAWKSLIAPKTKTAARAAKKKRARVTSRR